MTLKINKKVLLFKTKETYFQKEDITWQKETIS